VEHLAKLLSTGLLVWLGLLLALIAVRILRRDINVTGLLSNKPAAQGGDAVLPERVLTMAVFPTILIYYVISAMHADVSGPIPSLPNIPDGMLVILTGSNSLYLAGKIARG
jgi:hypothetical protein